MTYRRLFLFVEGDDDERFFRSVVLPALHTAYDNVQFVQFSTLKKEKLKGFLRSVVAMKADYILVRDLDRNPCATAAKDHILRALPHLDPDRVHIVKAEIESWYCAGIPEDHPWRSLTIGQCADTSTITKEAFETVVLRSGQPKLPTMLALLEGFDREAAIHRNESFHRFLRRFTPGLDT